MESITFTIVTPVYNREDCIEKCIESVSNQNYDDVEHWIVDDGSTDTTYEIVKECAAQYPIIKHHRFDKNRGVNAARNYAIKNSSNDFIIFLDSDDLLAENALRTIRDILYAHPEYQHYLFAQNDRMDTYNQNPLLKETITEITFADFLTEKITGDFAHVMANNLIRFFPFDEEFRVYENLNFYRIFKAEGKLLFVKKIVANRDRGRSDSVTKETRLNKKNALNNQYCVLKEMISLFENDYLEFHAEKILFNTIKRIFILGLALEKYNEIAETITLAKRYKVKIPLLFWVIYRMKLGFIFQKILFLYSNIKHSILR
jgi:glycosyltransferase involved in cell wall biosynthesis